MVQETILISIALDQLKELVNNAVSDALTKHSAKLQKAEETQPEFLTRKQVSTKLHISLATLDIYVKNGLLQSHKIGHRVLFKSDEINSLFQSIQEQKYKSK